MGTSASRFLGGLEQARRRTLVHILFTAVVADLCGYSADDERRAVPLKRHRGLPWACLSVLANHEGIYFLLRKPGSHRSRSGSYAVMIILSPGFGSRTATA